MSTCFRFTQQPLSHSLFRSCLTFTSNVYKRLGQFDYGRPSWTAGHIKTCFGTDDNGGGWIYIGEVKEGTDDTPHGIGIQVYDSGDTQQSNNKQNRRDNNYKQCIRLFKCTK